MQRQPMPIKRLDDLFSFSREDLLACEEHHKKEYKETLLIPIVHARKFTLFNKLVKDGICDAYYTDSCFMKLLRLLVIGYYPETGSDDEKECILGLLRNVKTTDTNFRQAFRWAMQQYFPIVAEKKDDLSLNTFLESKRIDATTMEVGLIDVFVLCFNVYNNYLTDKLKRALELYDCLKQFNPTSEFHTRALDEAKAGPILKGFLQTERLLRERAADDSEISRSDRLFGHKKSHSGVKKSDELLAAGQLNRLIREFITMPTDNSYKGPGHGDGYKKLAAKLEVLLKKYPVLKQGKLNEICTELGENIASDSGFKLRK